MKKLSEIGYKIYEKHKPDQVCAIEYGPEERREFARCLCWKVFELIQEGQKPFDSWERKILERDIETFLNKEGL